MAPWTVMNVSPWPGIKASLDSHSKGSPGTPLTICLLTLSCQGEAGFSLASLEHFLLSRLRGLGSVSLQGRNLGGLTILRALASGCIL